MSIEQPGLKKNRIRKGTIAGGIAIAMIGGFEGLRQNAYRDVVGVATVCYGETRGVKMGDRYSKAECDDMLIRRVQEFERAVYRCVPSLERAPATRAVAHVSLAYNIGDHGYCRSSIARLQNAGRWREACDFFLKYNRAKGIVFPGLTRRRQAERDLCLKE